ncbi:hypothetical protein ACJW8F_03685 [Plesiomonas shigelloides]|uniref:hypothetical protein n=1 Tax=Plesiomonas shigelloides TaxID=703 RepID=UPI00387EF125
MISFPVFPAVPRPLSGFFVSVAGDYRYVPHGGVFILLLSLISGPFVNRLWALLCRSLFCMMNTRVFAGGRALPFLPLGGGAIAAKD